jgi:hypothetical protein
MLHFTSPYRSRLAHRPAYATISINAAVQKNSTPHEDAQNISSKITSKTAISRSFPSVFSLARFLIYPYTFRRNKYYVIVNVLRLLGPVSESFRPFFCLAPPPAAKKDCFPRALSV